MNKRYYGYSYRTEEQTETAIFDSKEKRDAALRDELNTFLDTEDEIGDEDDFDEKSKQVIDDLNNDDNAVFIVFDDVSIQ